MRLLTRDSPLVIPVLRSAQSPLSRTARTREQVIQIKSGPLCTTEIQTPRGWNLLRCAG